MMQTRMRRCVRGANTSERSGRDRVCLRQRDHWKRLSKYLLHEIAITVLFVM
jgi:hypothetical protein